MAPILPHVRWNSRFAAVGKYVAAKRQRKSHHGAEAGSSWVTDMKMRPSVMNKLARIGVSLRSERLTGSEVRESSARMMPARQVGPTTAVRC